MIFKFKTKNVITRIISEFSSFKDIKIPKSNWKEYFAIKK